MIQFLSQLAPGLFSAAASANPPAAVGTAPAWVLLIPLLPMVGVVLTTLCAIFRVKSRLPAWLSVVCLGVAFALTAAMYAGSDGSTEIATAFPWFDLKWGDGPGQHFVAALGFYIDSLTVLWMLFVTGLGTLIALYASEYMAHDAGKGYSRFFTAFNLFVFSMSCLVMADNLVLLYLGWEGVGLCSYLLIGYFYKKPSAVAAAKKAFIVNRIGDLGLALGIFLIFTVFGTVEYKALFANADFQHYLDLAKAGDFGRIPFLVQLIPCLLMVGAFGKSAQFPLYVWLPDAMEGPTPVSALIHAATMVTAGVFLIARTYPVFQVSEYALPIVAWTGTITALLAATIGMAQFDIKRIMAYSTVSQLGYMFAGLGVLTSVGAASHVLTHAFFKALLFLSCGAVMHGFAGQLDLRRLSGVRKIPGWGVVGVCMLVGCLNLAGFPLVTSGFWSKDMILAQAFTTPGYAAIGWILLITAGLTAYYTFRVYFRVFEGPVEYEAGDELHGHDDHGHAEHGHADGHDDPTQPSGTGVPPVSTLSSSSSSDHDFHPHPPGWAINFVLVVLAVLSTAAVGLFFVHTDEHGWVGSMIHHSSAAWPASDEEHTIGIIELPPGQKPTPYPTEGPAAFAPTDIEVAYHHGTFLGMDPHAAMYYASAIVGLVGIVVAYVLHLRGRTAAERAKADDLLPMMGPIARWVQNKWYVDELYDFLIRVPLLVLSHVFHMIDRLIVDGLVDLAGLMPRVLGNVLRPSQSGQLHGYAAGMAGGVAFLLLIVLLVTR